MQRYQYAEITNFVCRDINIYDCLTFEKQGQAYKYKDGLQVFCDRNIEVISDNVTMATKQQQSIPRRTMSLPGLQADTTVTARGGVSTNANRKRIRTKLKVVRLQKCK